MMELERCARCPGFVPQGAHACPHCGAAISGETPARGRLGTVAKAAIALATATTLMACYGPGPSYYDAGNNTPETSGDAVTDTASEVGPVQESGTGP